MSNLLQRLLLFFLGIPLILALILFLPQFSHLAVVLVILVFTGGCSVELARLFEAREIPARPLHLVALGCGIPASAYLGIRLGGEAALSAAGLAILLGMSGLLLVLFIRFAFASADDIKHVLPRANAFAFAAIYPGLLGAFIVLIAAQPPYATESLLTFCIMAFANDSLAWLVGMTLGRRRGIVAVSPNKSVAGFVGGIVGSVGMAFGCAALFPHAMAGTWASMLFFGLAIGAAVILGDLFESALKRSAGTKDSGSAVPGRGGFLDTFDSLLFAAPVFFGLSLLLGFFR